MVLYGYHPVRELLRHRPHEALRVLTAARRGSPRRMEIEELCGRRGVALTEVSESELRRLAGAAEHNGFLAETRAVMAPSKAADLELRVLVEDVQDPRNLGALLRVCEGAGVGQVLVRDRGSAPLSATVVKTSAGASEWLDVQRVTNSARSLEELKAAGFWVYGADAGGVPPWEVDLSGPVLLCFGGEQKGLRALTRQRCDHLVGLPMRGHVESLNLATAAAAVLYEAVRQRLRRGGESR